MTRIKNSSECERKFREDFKRGLFSEDDGIVLKAWALEMEEYGPSYIEMEGSPLNKRVVRISSILF